MSDANNVGINGWKEEITIKVGFGDNVENLRVRISDGDIPPYQVGENLALVGTTADRVDAVAKVTGKAKYTYDRKLPDMLHAKMVRCPHANANVESVDLSAALKMPGVKAALDLTRILRRKSARFAGEAVAAVAAETEAQAEAAARAVRVSYDVLEFAVTTTAAMEDDAPQVGRGDDTNVVPVTLRGMSRRGGEERAKQALARREKKTDEALKRSHKVVEGTFETQVQTHASLETHGVVCDWDGDDLLCYASTQATFIVKGQLSGRRGPVGAENVRVMSEFVGGGFGSKFIAGDEGYTGALLAREAGQPVKLMLDRREEHLATGNRPDSIQKLTLGVDKDGKIEGYRARNWGTAGTGTRGAGASNDTIYNFGDKDTQAFAVRTNTGGARPMRSPGWPQGNFGMESIVDMAAHAAGVDPIALRKKNDTHPVRKVEYDIGAERIDWEKKRNKKPGSDRGPIKSGIGMASTSWYNSGGRGAACLVRVHKNGAIEVRNGAQDIGTGTRTVMGMVAAEELGVPLDKVQTFIGDTNDPRGPASGGSTTAATLTPAARLAAFRAKKRLLESVADDQGLDAADLDLRGGEVIKDGKSLAPKVSFDAACAMMEEDLIEELADRNRNYDGFVDALGGVQYAEVEVDTETGEVKVKKVVAVQDAGVFINKKTAESQIRGGVIQGMTYALHETRVMDRVEGRMLNANFDDYKISGPVDCPEIDVVLVDVFNGKNATSCMGLGEAPNIPTAAAIANAVFNATGARVMSLPITPAKVLDALAKVKKG